MVHVTVTQGLVEQEHVYEISPSQERTDLCQHVARRAYILLTELVDIKMH